MNWQLIFAIAGAVSTVVVSFATWGFITGRYAGVERQKAEHLAHELEQFRADVQRRFHEAGKETSDAWSYVQGIESKFIREFAPRELTDERFAENRRDHDRFNAFMDRRSQPRD